ncbi:MAG: DUF4167 domain-containing protein [Alphaproteobacteria bacterium]|nr:DUF4167 domain-containing protein [Alphaproteobacteria bacterium]
MNNQKQNRGRHRNNARRSNPSRQNFDSNGPGIRIRGNATQVYEKYIQLARDAQGSGDRVMAENMLQHAEHYYRILNDGNNDRQARQQQADPANESQPDTDSNDDTDNSEDTAASADSSSGNDSSNSGGNNGGGSGRGRGRRSSSNSSSNGGGSNGGGRGRGRRSRSADADAPAAESADAGGEAPAAVAEAPAQQELSITAD